MGKAKHKAVKLDLKSLETRDTTTCMTELMGTLACLHEEDYSMSRCGKDVQLLLKCVKEHAPGPKEKNTINFHLSRLLRKGK
mmetsp:Transcript_22679/g.27398  ORF Transcript_22679/g.27398 Transcript_22679/m.27398 type:complete len:82 (-) Transcript_22679:557-802(-)